MTAEIVRTGAAAAELPPLLTQTRKGNEVYVRDRGVVRLPTVLDASLLVTVADANLQPDGTLAPASPTDIAARYGRTATYVRHRLRALTTTLGQIEHPAATLVTTHNEKYLVQPAEEPVPEPPQGPRPHLIVNLKTGETSVSVADKTGTVKIKDPVKLTLLESVAADTEAAHSVDDLVPHMRTAMELPDASRNASVPLHMSQLHTMLTKAAGTQVLEFISEGDDHGFRYHFPGTVEFIGAAGSKPDTKPERLTKVPQTMVIDFPSETVTINREGDEPRREFLEAEESVLLDLLARQPGVAVPAETLLKQARAYNIDLRGYERLFQRMRHRLEGFRVWSVMSFTRNVRNRPDDVTLLMDQVTILDGTDTPLVFTAPWMDEPGPETEKQPEAEPLPPGPLFFVTPTEDALSVIVIVNGKPTEAKYRTRAGRAIAEYMLTHLNEELRTSDLAHVVPHTSRELKKDVNYVKMVLERGHEKGSIFETGVGKASTFTAKGAVLEGDPPAQILAALAEGSSLPVANKATEMQPAKEVIPGLPSLWVESTGTSLVITVFHDGKTHRTTIKAPQQVKLAEYILGESNERLTKMDIADSTDLSVKSLSQNITRVKNALEAVHGAESLFHTTVGRNAHLILNANVFYGEPPEDLPAPTPPTDKVLRREKHSSGSSGSLGASWGSTGEIVRLAPTAAQAAARAAGTEKPVVEVVATAGTDARQKDEKHTWTDAEHALVTTFLTRLTDTPEGATIVELRDALWDGSAGTKVTDRQVLDILRTASKARFEIREDKSRIIAARYERKRVAGYAFDTQAETTADVPDLPAAPVEHAPLRAREVTLATLADLADAGKEEEIAIASHPFTLVAEEAHQGERRGFTTVKDLLTDKEYRLGRVFGHLLIQLGFGQENALTGRELQTRLEAIVGVPIDIAGTLGNFKQNEIQTDFPYDILGVRNAEGRMTYFLAEKRNDLLMEGEDLPAASLAEAIDLTVSRPTPYGFTTHELSALAAGLIGDERVAQLFAGTAIPFFPDEEMLRDVIAANGLPRSENMLDELIIPTLNKAEERLLNMADDREFYIPHSDPDVEDQTSPSEDTWALLFALMHIHRVTFENDRGQRISGLAYISERYANPQVADTFRPVRAHKKAKSAIIVSNTQLSDLLDEEIAAKRILPPAPATDFADADVTNLDEL